MAYQIKWSEKSKQDLIEIIDYLISSWGNNSAKKFKNKVLSTIEIISKFPIDIPFNRIPGKFKTLLLVVKQVSLYFQVNEKDKELYLVRFIDNRRDPIKISDSLNEDN